MSRYSVERSIEINVPQEKVWGYIASFEKQVLWSPWLTLEPTCKRKVTGTDGEVGAVDSWEGEIVGAGERENLDMVENDYIDQEIRFLKPFKSTARVYFSLQRVGDNSCSLTWGMEGKLPFFMFFMKEKMKAFIASDYDRGLLMLKQLCETGSLDISLEDKGEQDFNEVYFISREHRAPYSAMPELMQDDFKTLMKFAQESSLNILSVRSYYPKVDFVSQMFSFKSIIEISKEEYEKIIELPEGCMKGHFPAGKAYSMQYNGAYKFLGNAWTGTYMYLKARKKKVNASIPPFELYLNDPAQVDEKDLKTQILVPIK